MALTAKSLPKIEYKFSDDESKSPDYQITKPNDLSVQQHANFNKPEMTSIDENSRIQEIDSSKFNGHTSTPSVKKPVTRRRSSGNQNQIVYYVAALLSVTIISTTLGLGYFIHLKNDDAVSKINGFAKIVSAEKQRIEAFEVRSELKFLQEQVQNLTTHVQVLQLNTSRLINETIQLKSTILAMKIDAENHHNATNQKITEVENSNHKNAHVISNQECYVRTLQQLTNAQLKDEK